MDDFEVVAYYRKFERMLNENGYKVSAMASGFYIHNEKGTIVASCNSTDGLNAFLQAVEYLNKDKI